MNNVGEFVISSVLSHHSKHLKQQMDQCSSSVLFRKQRRIHPPDVKAGRLKRYEGKRCPSTPPPLLPPLNFGPSFYMIFSPPPILSYVNWASQEGCLFYLRSHSGPWTFLCSVFCGLFPSFSFSHRHSGLLFPILNYPTKLYISQIF